MNVAVDYLDSKIDPRNNRENFKRVTGSIRSNKKWTHDNIITTWQTSVNYTGTFERDDNDPDLTVNNTIDFYSSRNHTVSLNNTVVARFPLQKFIQSLTLTQGLSYGYDRIHQDKTVASSRLYPMPVSTTAGDHYVGYLPMVYDAAFDVTGRPFTGFTKLSSIFKYSYGPVSNILKAGMEWNMSKNYGKGQIYDMMRPITAGNTSRPRPFNDIPAMHQLSAYIENTADIALGDHIVEAMIGVRETQLLHLSEKYSLRNRPYLDPRINVKWTLPSPDIAAHPLKTELSGGFGWHTKMPTGAYLYPNPLYLDFAQQNYFHNDEAVARRGFGNN
ncbi:MAG: outer membrane receptor protein, partial [Muribaculaceae bacterium]|nr:outer membrane receptor protein [Muribaculaceae bacterium]